MSVTRSFVSVSPLAFPRQSCIYCFIQINRAQFFLPQSLLPLFASSLSLVLRHLEGFHCRLLSVYCLSRLTTRFAATPLHVHETRRMNAAHRDPRKLSGHCRCSGGPHESQVSRESVAPAEIESLLTQTAQQRPHGDPWADHRLSTPCRRLLNERALLSVQHIRAAVGLLCVSISNQQTPRPLSQCLPTMILCLWHGDGLQRRRQMLGTVWAW